MGVPGDVLVEPVHERPTLFLAPNLEPARDIEETRARGVGIGHHHVALVDRLGQVLPRARHGQTLLLPLYRVETDRSDPGPLPHPKRRVVLGIHIGRIQLFDALGRVTLEVAFIGQHHQAGRRQAPDDVRLRVILFGQQLGGDDAGGIAHPLDIDVRVVLLELPLEHGELVGLDRRVDQQLGLGKGGAPTKSQGK